MNRYLGDSRTGDAKESIRSKLTGQVEAFLSDGGKIEQVPGGKTGMTKYLKNWREKQLRNLGNRLPALKARTKPWQLSWLCPYHP